MRITGTVDLECASWDRFGVAATYEPVGGVTIHRSIGALVDYLIKRKGTWWAHAGGTYDALAIAEELRRRLIPCSIDLAGARISRLMGGGFTLRDSYPLVPLPLDVACGIAGEDAPELALPCRCGLACGGYCSIRPNDTRAAVSAYCAADARVLYRILCAVRDVASQLGLSLRGTLGGTAWATARDMLDLPNQDLSPALWRTAREAYYGGRVTIARPLCAGPGEHWDLSSAYPAALASLELPCGDWKHEADSAAELAFDRDRPGIYGAVVNVPFSFLPPLPIRQRGRLTYPTGRFRGAWCLRELQLAIDRGVEVESIEWAITWSHARNIFEGLIARWWDARSKAGKDTPLGRLLRLLCNSLPGKFAEAPDRRAARMFPSKIRHCTLRRPCTIERCTGACGAWEQLDLWGQTWGVPFYRPSPSAHIQWGAYVTAQTRAHWLVAAEAQGERHLVYGDTDSIWTTSKRAPSPRGNGLGEWELKHAWSNWECRAPRQYRYDQDGRTQLKTAGARATVNDWNRGESVESRGVLTFMEAARSMERAPRETGLFRRRAQRWTLPTSALETGRYGDRLLDSRTGITYPLPYGE